MERGRRGKEGEDKENEEERCPQLRVYPPIINRVSSAALT